MKLKRKMEETDDSMVYRRARWEHLVESGKSKGNSCSLCPPHQGCNAGRYGMDNSWKNHRKTQYKAVDVSLSPISPDLQDLFDDGVITRDLLELLNATQPVDEVLAEINEE